MAQFLSMLNSFLWGAPVLVLLFAVGVLYAVKTSFFQFRHFGHILKSTAGEMFRKGSQTGDGTLTPLQAVSSALAGCVGTGNISGVATAIFVGGPGAVFWMWIISLFGMLTKCVEVTLAQYYRVKGDDGVYYGGPMYYIERGMGKKWKPLAIFFAITIILGGLGTAAFVQPFAMSNAMNNAFQIPHWVVIVIAATVCGIVLIGGVQGIGKFCEKVTPVMCLVYIVAVVGILLTHITELPAAFATIFTHAFTPLSATGGLAGSTVAMTIKQGAARGTFSNEGGCGTSPITHATAITEHPFKEGMYGSFEVFIDTLVVCTMTALAIICSGEEIWQSGLKDVMLTQSAFANTYGTAGPILVSVCLSLFAFSTMVGWEINYESAFFYIFPKLSASKTTKLAIRLIWLVPGFLSLGQTPELVWTVVDIVAGFWCIPNAIALLFLSGTFMKVYNDYTAKYIDKTRPLSEKLN
ncbi:MAG: sodium:alanine symporter family protein [Eubacteriales bacterium]|nr:sodium:alanine symporter family protein [Eubacteriales bacterium]